MSEGTSITVAGDWGKPASILIEKVSEAIGGAFKPRQLKRVAKAERENRIEDAKAEVECKDILAASGYGDSPLGERAINRMVGQEIQKQLNIENITRLAAEKLDETSKPEELEQDFIADLFAKAENTSDEVMQSLWASILAGQANKPQSFSKRTVNLVSQLDKRDAELFTKFCECVWMNGERPTALITKSSDFIFWQQGIGFEQYSHLEALGFIQNDQALGYSFTFGGEHIPERAALSYFSTPIIIKFEPGPPKIQLGNALLTEAGRQLAVISGAKPNSKVFEATLSDIIAMHSGVFSPWPREQKT